MFNKRTSIAILLVLPFLSIAQKQDTIPLSQILEEVQINGVNAGEKTPVSYTNISESEIEKIQTQLQSLLNVSFPFQHPITHFQKYGPVVQR